MIRNVWFLTVASSIRSPRFIGEIAHEGLLEPLVFRADWADRDRRAVPERQALDKTGRVGWHGKMKRYALSRAADETMNIIIAVQAMNEE